MSRQNLKFKKDNRNIDNVLKEEDVITIKHSKISKSLPSIIKKIDSNCLYIKKPKEIYKNRVRVNDEIYLNVVENIAEYILIGKVLRNSSKDKSLMKIEILKIFKYENRRRSRRFFVSFQGYINIEEKKVYGIIKNVSRNGLSILLKNEIDISNKEILDIVLLIEENEFIEFKVKIIRIMINGVFNEYGLDILFVKESSKSIFEQLLLKLEYDQFAYVKEYLK